MRPVTVVPSGFDENAAQVGIACLADRAEASLGSARVLGRDETGVAHHRASMVKSTKCAELGSQGDGCDLGDPAQSLQGVNDRPEMLGSGLDGRIDGGFEAVDSLGLRIPPIVITQSAPS